MTAHALQSGPSPATEVQVDIAAGTGSTAAIDLSGYLRRPVMLFWLPDSKGSGHACHLRFGPSTLSAATTSDAPLTEEHPVAVVKVDSEKSHFRAIASGGIGSLFYAPIDRNQ